MEQIPNNNDYQLEEEQIINIEEFISDFSKKVTNLMEFEKEPTGEIIEKSLLKELAPLHEETYYNLLPELFDILIDIYIKKSRELAKPYFIPLEVCYNIFLLFEFRLMPMDTIEKLIGALQWGIIEPQWIDYNFIKAYYEKLHQKVPYDLRIKTWNLVELTKIKQQEFKRKK